jgi:hypothetical protein
MASKIRTAIGSRNSGSGETCNKSSCFSGVSSSLVLETPGAAVLLILL